MAVSEISELSSRQSHVPNRGVHFLMCVHCVQNARLELVCNADSWMFSFPVMGIKCGAFTTCAATTMFHPCDSTT